MKDDPVIGEIRRVRHQISARVGHDVRRLGEHYMELERKARQRPIPVCRNPREVRNGPARQACQAKVNGNPVPEPDTRKTNLPRAA